MTSRRVLADVHHRDFYMYSRLLLLVTQYLLSVKRIGLTSYQNTLSLTFRQLFLTRTRMQSKLEREKSSDFGFMLHVNN